MGCVLWVPSLNKVYAFFRSYCVQSRVYIRSRYIESTHHKNMLNAVIVNNTSRVKQGKSEGFDSCDRPSNLTRIVDFSASVTLKFDGWPRKMIRHLFYITSSFVHHLKPLGEFKLELLSANAQFGSKSACDLEIWWMTLKNNRAPLLCCFKLCTSFHSHRWIQTKVRARKRSIRVKIGDLLSLVTSKFEGWPWKTIGHLFYVVSSFVHHFIAIGEFELKLESGNAQFGSKSAIYCPMWPRNLTDDLEKQ